jgi:hypothetical protein
MVMVQKISGTVALYDFNRQGGFSTVAWMVDCSRAEPIEADTPDLDEV